MKPLEISEEQKAKLLEICKVLFPEYIHIEITKGKHVKLFSEWKDHGSHISYKTKDTASIHWFEFCMLKIFPKLNQWFNAHQLSDFFYQTIGNDKKCEPNVLNKFEHPIDYLYEQFKKL